MMVDGVELKPGDRVLVVGQSTKPWYHRLWLWATFRKPDPPSNGVYIVSDK